MEQPLDFSKSTSSAIRTPSSSFAAKSKQLQRFNSKSLKNFTNEYHVHNSENSDENTSRSSASSPDSLESEQAALNAGHNTLSQQALLMLAAVSNPNLAAMNFNAQQLINSSSVNDASDLNSKLINQLNNFNAAQSTTGHSTVPTITTTTTSNNAPFLLSSQSLVNSTAPHAAQVVISNMMNQQQFGSFANHLNHSNHQTNTSTTTSDINTPATNKQSKQSNQIKQSKSSGGGGHKAVSRKSMIMAKQQEEQKSISPQQSTMRSVVAASKFGILSNSQNSNILQIDADIDSESHSPLLNNSLQISINSNLSGEENSMYSDLFSQDDGSPRSQRRRGNPIPESLKDDSYWVRRRKNNEAAKKSRDAKRAKDLITAKRAVLLENENSQLKLQLNQIRSENLILRSFFGDEAFCDDKLAIDELISVGRKVEPEKVRTFAQEFLKIFGLHQHIERMES